MPPFTISRLIAKIGLLLLGLGLAHPALAQGDLLIAPTRVIINNAGSAEVVLSNIGTQPATYRIGLELRRMTASGELIDVAEADANPAEQAALAMVRHAPRRISLLPGQPQSVRISARPAAELPDGEYRVHLTFRGVPPTISPEEAAKADPTSVTIRLTPVYGISIPVIVRKGRLDAGATLANPKVVQDATGSYLTLDLARTGARSVYGEISVKSARGEALFHIRGIAVYPELDRRSARFQLTPEQAAKLKGPVRIEYRELPEQGGALIADLAATLP